MRIVVVCVGRLRGSPLADAAAHYERLLSRQARVEIAELRELGADPARRAEILAKEAAAVRRRIPPGAFVCALDREGGQLSSPDFARWLEERRRDGRDVCFIVGGPLGLDAALLNEADQRLSLGAPTLPHQLARVVLLEQVFRGHKILSGEPYHY